MQVQQPSSPETEARHAILALVSAHWHERNYQALPQCACGKLVDDINEHLADELMAVIYAYVGEGGTTHQVRVQYGEQIPGFTTIQPFADTDRIKRTKHATHRRKIIVQRDWEEIPR